jgi:AsmA protein
LSKIIKAGFWVIGVLALSLIAAVAAVSLILDPNDYKARIEQALEEATGRAVSIQGDISLAVYPRLGVQTGRVVLANVPDFSESTFASVEHMRLDVRLVPLFWRRLEVGSVLLDGLRVNLVWDENQRGSWEGLGESTRRRPRVSSPEPAPGAPDRGGENQTPPLMADFSIGALKLKNGRIRWHDVTKAQRYTLEDVSLETGVIRPNEPISVKMASRVLGDSPALKGDLTMTGELQFNPKARIFNLDGLELNADALMESPPAEAALNLTGDVVVDLANHTVSVRSFVAKPKFQDDAAAVAVRATLSGGLNGDWVAGIYSLRGFEFRTSVDDPQKFFGSMELTGGASADLNLVEQTLKVPYLNLSALGLKLTGALEGERLLQALRVDGALEVAQFDLWPLLKRFGHLPPETVDLGALDDASLKTEFSAGPHSINLTALTARLGDTTLEGSVGVPDFRGPSLGFDLAVDAIDVNRYLPAGIDRESTGKTKAPSPASADKGAGGAAPKGSGESPFEPLRSLHMDGRLRVGMLTAGKVTLRDVELPVRAESGVIVFSPVKANLFGGRYTGNIGLDVSAQEPRIALDDRFTAVQAGPLLRALAGQDRLAGIADASVKLTFQGSDADRIRQSLNGTTRFSFREGSFKGINIGRLLREAEAAIRGKPLAPDTQPLQTDFTALDATIHFANAVASSDDLKAKSPLLRLSGEGTADLTRNTLDYLLTAVLVASPQGQGGKELSELQGVPVPIRVTGTFAKPDFAVDLEALLKAQVETITEAHKQELQKKIEKEIEKKLNQPLPEGAKDLLRKLF